jgi:hypothetical protein
MHVAWMLLARRPSNSLPWVLQPTYSTGWRLFNLARDPVSRRAVPAALAVATYAIELADRSGMDTFARVDADQRRLLAVYVRRGGFRVASSDSRAVSLYRTAADREPTGTGGTWRKVLRTGRVTLPEWQARFGTPRGPFLDLGAGDSMLGAQLATAGVITVSLDPSYAAHRPARGSAVAGLAEQLPFKHGSFATIHANFVLQHVQRPRRALAECVRTARQDGQLVLHPVWARRPVRSELDRLPGVRIVPGHALPPRRHRPSLVLTPGEFGFTAHGAQVVAALRPHPIIMWVGRAAMCAVVRARAWRRSSP